jgi:hypothetical protein
LTDFFSKAVGFVGQNGGEKDSPEQYRDNLFEPVSGYDTVEGNFSDEQLRSDPYAFVKTNPKVTNSLLLGAGALGAFLVWRKFRKNGGENGGKLD